MMAYRLKYQEPPKTHVWSQELVGVRYESRLGLKAALQVQFPAKIIMILNLNRDYQYQC